MIETRPEDLDPQATAGNRRIRRDAAASRAADAKGVPADEIVRWVCLDVGETLIDETRVWSTWADVLGVTRFTFMAVLGAVISNGEDHQNVFERLGRPDWRELRPGFAALYGGFRSDDLYPDALPALNALRTANFRISILANQPAERTAELRALGVRADLIAMSDELGVHKPAPEFYARALELMEAKPTDVTYVGDRLDNDVLPASAAGMRAVWIVRGPWALLTTAAPPQGTLVVRTLTELTKALES